MRFGFQVPIRSSLSLARARRRDRFWLRVDYRSLAVSSRRDLEEFVWFFWGYGLPLIRLAAYMEQACLWSTCDQSLLFSFGEVFDWRFLMLGDFLLVSFVNCT
ncbi:hypothetical protein EUGRSUZ_E01242 [Eucalyptus grandis]|uniref:Uncharacterized protein n=2 Tax=Eucalyptus grandis TaxID=71139 RepID=A0ACC3KW26_EUCGR|nr:hypothetical protein EUGRSUZ_E01242 [Eucalyptus grandis]